MNKRIYPAYRCDRTEPCIHRRPGESRGPASFGRHEKRHWIPAFAGMTKVLGSALVLALYFLLPVTTLHAAEATFGAYTVHYNAVNSTFLTPTIAQQYGIVRAERRAFLNIAVLKNNVDGSTTPVTAQLSGGKRNLLQQSAAIDFREIREGEAIYYIGEFDFSNAEILRFSVQVQPEGQGESHALEWTTQLYAQ